MKTRTKYLVGATLLVTTQAYSALLIMPTPLNTAVKPPMTVKINGALRANGINTLIRNNNAAIQLGKALFWDTAVGSDGVACASCHFKAGADSRVINQINPGFKHDNPALNHVFDAFPGGTIGPNKTLKLSDFPMFQFGTTFRGVPQDPLLGLTASVINDTVSSAGTQSGIFNPAGTPRGPKEDACTPRVSDEFSDLGLGFRNVEPRNTPTVNNATFNVRNFWDGRANRIFNGVNPFGLRDTNAKIWMNPAGLLTGLGTQVKLEVNNASLASQAVGPVLSDLEMHCKERTFDQVGAKIVSRVPLQNQRVSRTDSVLAPLLTPGFQSTKFVRNTITYRSLIQQAFVRSLWAGRTTGDIPLDEANFALFFGLAVQAYEDTLRSGESKYDNIPRRLQNFVPPGALPGTPPIVRAPLPIRQANGQFRGLTLSESRGLDLFMGQISPLNPQNGVDAAGVPIPQKNGRCILCHNGPEFTSAAFTALAGAPAGVRILDPAAVPVEFLAEPMPFAAAAPGAPIPLDVGVPIFDPALGFGTYDLGFYDIGVTPLANDHGLGGNDPFGNPLAFAKQWENAFNNGTPCPISPLGIAIGGAACAPTSTLDVFNVNVNFANLDGTPLIMTPLLAPAKTDGSFKTPSLRNVQLTAPYFHNGSTKSIEEALLLYNNGGIATPLNPNHHPEIIPLFFNSTDIADVAAFLRTLTDPRVRFERAPFDHPALAVPNGHTTAPILGTTIAQDALLQIPAVGSAGLNAEPLRFEQRLAP